MEVAPFFVGFHNLRSFVAIYIMSRFTHFFRNFFLAKIASSATSHIFCMYAYRSERDGSIVWIFGNIFQNWRYFAVVIEPFFGWVFWTYNLIFNTSDHLCCLLSRPAAWRCVQVIVMVVCHTPKTLVNLHESYQMLRSSSLWTMLSLSTSFFITIAIITLKQ